MFLCSRALCKDISVVSFFALSFVMTHLLVCFLFHVRCYICKIVKITQGLEFDLSLEKNYDVFVRFLDRLATWSFFHSFLKTKRIQSWAVPGSPCKGLSASGLALLRGVVSQLPTKREGYSPGPLLLGRLRFLTPLH